MKTTRKQLRRIIRESISQNEIQKIEQLWWNHQDVGDKASGYFFKEYDQREQAAALIDAFGIDPKTLKIWEIVLPDGQILNDDWGLTVSEVEQIIEKYNNLPDTPFKVQLAVTTFQQSGGDSVFAETEVIDADWNNIEGWMIEDLEDFFVSEADKFTR